MNGHDFPQLSWLGCGFFNPQKMARSLGYDWYDNQTMEVWLIKKRDTIGVYKLNGILIPTYCMFNWGRLGSNQEIWGYHWDILWKWCLGGDITIHKSGCSPVNDGTFWEFSWQSVECTTWHPCCMAVGMGKNGDKVHRIWYSVFLGLLKETPKKINKQSKKQIPKYCSGFSHWEQKNILFSKSKCSRQTRLCSLLVGSILMVN